MSHSVRRSRRTRKANKKYTNDGWDETTLKLLEDSGVSDTSSPAKLSTTEGHAENEESDDADKSDGYVEEQETNLDDYDQPPSDVRTLSGSDDEASVVSRGGSRVEKSRNLHQKRSTLKPEGAVHSRGLHDIPKRLGRKTKYESIFGPELEDLQPIIEARDRWHLRGRDATLPSQATLSEVLDDDHVESSLPQKEMDTASDNAFLAFARIAANSQQLDRTSMEIIRSQGYNSGPTSQKVVLGPWKHETAYEIRSQESLDLGRAWKKPIPTEPLEIAQSTQELQNELKDVTEEAHGSSDGRPKVNNQLSAYHHGWLINAGEKVHCLAWAPYEDGHAQYLAVVCRSTSLQRNGSATTSRNQGISPAFSSSSRYSSIVQIWRFASRSLSRNKLASLDRNVKPQLCLLLSCDHGDIREAKWMPTERSRSPEDGIGWLAIIATDGCARLLLVPNCSPSSTEPLCLQVSRPGVLLQPSNESIFTAITFASTSDLIVGASDGSIYLYNLAQLPTTAPPQPFSTIRPHHTYVLSLATAGLGDLSHYLVSASAANDLVLTDLRNPAQDTIQLAKSRLPTKNLIYSPCSQTWITTVDPSGRTDATTMSESRVIAHGLRHFHVTQQLSRFSQDSGSATALAGSVRHPYILVGTSQGTVTCQNVMRRLSPAGTFHKPISWVQKVCECQWIPTSQSRLQSSSGNDAVDDSQRYKVQDSLYYGNDTRSGVSRFLEGFKAEKQDLTLGTSSATPRKSTERGKGKKRKATVISTEDPDDGSVDGLQGERNEIGQVVIAEVIYEEEQAVTAIAWNENPKCAGWAAVGWGSGIVRVQDLSHEAI